MRSSLTAKLSNLSFQDDLPLNEKHLLGYCGDNTKICTPFEVLAPKNLEIGNYVSINREMKINIITDIRHHIGYLSQYDNSLVNSVEESDYVFNNPKVYIGDRTSFGRYCFISATNLVTIGEAVIFSDRVYISDTEHRYECIEIPIIYQSMTKSGKVEIKDHCWIGVGATILNCTIGRHCIIGAHAVVTNDIPDYSVAVGMPARVIKQYNHKNRKWESVL